MTCSSEYDIQKTLRCSHLLILRSSKSFWDGRWDLREIIQVIKSHHLRGKCTFCSCNWFEPWPWHYKIYWKQTDGDPEADTCRWFQIGPCGSRYCKVSCGRRVRSGMPHVEQRGYTLVYIQCLHNEGELIRGRTIATRTLGFLIGYRSCTWRALCISTPKYGAICRITSLQVVSPSSS